MTWLDQSRTEPVRREPDEDPWVRCERCGAYLHRATFVAELKVCRQCGYHHRLTAVERIESLLDPESFEETHVGIAPSDPLEFRSGANPYAEKITETRAKTGLSEAVVTGLGRIESIDVVVAVMDFRFFGGSLGSGTGEKILRAALDALRLKRPYIVVSSSGGARMQEGALSLMQMAKTCAGIGRLDAHGVPYISVLTHPTTGGVLASFAMVGDVNIAEPGALIGFAGRRVIEQTIKQSLPDDFQSAEYLLDQGFVDMVVPRKALRTRIAEILGYARSSKAKEAT